MQIAIMLDLPLNSTYTTLSSISSQCRTTGPSMKGRKKICENLIMLVCVFYMMAHSMLHLPRFGRVISLTAFFRCPLLAHPMRLYPLILPGAC
mmetsp:Transcript_1187/g.1505  ORF Transcript_1187/g.1505 Transcript_1187/m.1505 type:complete len:93 (+) Transcript_1187:1140-1418(+)